MQTLPEKNTPLETPLLSSEGDSNTAAASSNRQQQQRQEPPAYSENLSVEGSGGDDPMSERSVFAAHPQQQPYPPAPQQQYLPPRDPPPQQQYPYQQYSAPGSSAPYHIYPQGQGQGTGAGNTPHYGAPHYGVPHYGAPPEIRLYLLNPQQISSGFTTVMPPSLSALAQTAPDSSRWTAFISELNQALRRAPGALTTGVAGHWLINLVTLGMSSHGCEMHRSLVENKAAAILERYNRVEFAQWGIRAHFDVVPLATGGGSAYADHDAASGSNRQHGRHRQQRDSNHNPAEATRSLELVFVRA
ncbi:hypothetical protein GGI07_005454 [Coemansia sp. Benny D115]|nr:hypothetical protein GGI07_005454 [Coemansia sp. Benny D115]